MDAKARVVIESAVHRTLHAHSFSRSSSQASIVLTDLLSRYLTILASTCAKYAQHAGRTNLTIRDALCAMDDLGISMTELGEYCVSEGAEMGRYAINTARRTEELKDFRVHLADGLKRKREDGVVLVYAPIPNDLPSQDSDEDVNQEDPYLRSPAEAPTLNGTYPHALSVDRPMTPPLPLSPTSDPPSPPCKRQRVSSQEPLLSQSPRMPPPQPPPLKIERPSSPLLQPSTPTYASDYFMSVPYSQSSLSSESQWHLPSRAPRHSQPHSSRLSVPQTQPALFRAYHHILTNPLPPSTSSTNPSRHKVAMALLSLIQANPRWDPPDTLYSSSAPCPPRVAVIGPTFPVLVGTAANSIGDSKNADAERERKANLLPLPPRAVFANERITPLITQQPSRIPELARQVLPVSVYSRATRLSHPPPLYREGRGDENQRLLYGSGVNAPWNTNGGISAVASTPTTVKTKEGEVSESMTNGKGVLARIIPDARLYTTWDYEVKRHNEAIPVTRRGRVGSMSGLTFSISGRAHSEGRL